MITDTNIQPELVDAAELAEILGISKSAAYTLMHNKSFPAIRIGKRMYAIREQIPQWIRQQAIRGGYDYGR